MTGPHDDNAVQSGIQNGILVVDDNPDNVRLLTSILSANGFPVRVATDGASAVAVAQARTPDLVLLDVMLPDFDGYEVCRRLKADEALRDVPVLFLSALLGTGDKVRAFAVGGEDYVTKPLAPEEILARVRTHLALRVARLELQARNRELQTLKDHLEDMVAERTAALVAANRDLASLTEERRHVAERLERGFFQTVEAIGAVLEKRDPYTAGHQARVAELAEAIGRQLALDERRLQGVRLGALIHDIGKVAVPAEILSRPGRLSAAEFSLIAAHPQIGHDIISRVDLPWPVAEILLSHHERMDGSGYPNKKAGAAIIPEARIVAVADVVEAMTAHRPYRPSQSVDAALAEIEGNAGTRYDADVVAACLKLFRRDGFAWTASPWLPE
ncbi:MAG TPA: HD domain-containing phosphohydrolase [Azospirillum sp.]|nr:HD domain-containing phosphohydrolase [Azospirillum sp.]